jgi:hypothetical protein
MNTESSLTLDQLIDGLEATISAGLKLHSGSAPSVSNPRCQTEEFCTEATCLCHAD